MKQAVHDYISSIHCGRLEGWTQGNPTIRSPILRPVCVVSLGVDFASFISLLVRLSLVIQLSRSRIPHRCTHHTPSSSYFTSTGCFFGVCPLGRLWLVCIISLIRVFTVVRDIYNQFTVPLLPPSFLVTRRFCHQTILSLPSDLPQ